MYFKFEPLLKQTLWGGDRIIPFKHLETQMDNVGESWEISGVPGSETIVSEGQYKGKSLNDLVGELKAELVGKANYERFGNEFPLLIKFIDARRDLSIQVHPDEETAHRQGHEHGKTEMWYCLGSGNEGESGKRGADAYLYNGLKKQITPEEYKKMVENDTITDALARYEVCEGDVFFIPAGRIHAIGAGCFVAEIQQTSDVTYRIYDFKRRDKDGNFRQLHTALAAEAIHYDVLPDYRTHYKHSKDEPQQVVACPYFTTAVYDLTEPMLLDYSDLDSFVILIAVGGEGSLTAGGQQTSLRMGETILLPATTCEVKIEGTVKFLETFV
ncbi:MAG: class I mannose-6-phosphate isomerase [Prevotella sp.]|nr:class I mannose-6-phosphate isomerase [Prevotella sp.]